MKSNLYFIIINNFIAQPIKTAKKKKKTSHSPTNQYPSNQSELFIVVLTRQWNNLRPKYPHETTSKQARQVLHSHTKKTKNSNNNIIHNFLSTKLKLHEATSIFSVTLTKQDNNTTNTPTNQKLNRTQRNSRESAKNDTKT